MPKKGRRMPPLRLAPIKHPATLTLTLKLITRPHLPWGGRRQVIKTKRRREMNAQAKDLFRDADAAQKFFTKV